MISRVFCARNAAAIVEADLTTVGGGGCNSGGGGGGGGSHDGGDAGGVGPGGLPFFSPLRPGELLSLTDDAGVTRYGVLDGAGVFVEVEMVGGRGQEEEEDAAAALA